MRITQRDLDIKVDRLNKMAGFDNPEYSTIGAYCLDYAYGGVSLRRYVNFHGGVTDVFWLGYMPKKELYHLICAYETGLTERNKKAT